MAERIKCVAIKQGRLVFTPVENSSRHHDLMREMARCGLPLPIVGEQGFMTDSGRFVDRIEACAVASVAGQIVNKTDPWDQLFSEDLW